MISNIAMICPDKTDMKFSCLVTNIAPELISVKPGQVFPLEVMQI